MTKWIALGLAALVIVPSTARAALLVANGGFESGSAMLGARPTVFAQWQGDRVGYVTAENGITPAEGTRMLRFINTSFGPGVTDGSQYWQNVDLSLYASDIDAGRAYLQAAVLFNRVPGNAGTDTEFNLVVRARSGSPTSFSDLAEASWMLHSDSLPATWEQASIAMLLPSGTRFVQVEINAVENVVNNATNPEFNGHYADSVTLNLTVVPEPPGWVPAMVGGGLLAIRRLRRGGREPGPAALPAGRYNPRAPSDS